MRSQQHALSTIEMERKLFDIVQSDDDNIEEILALRDKGVDLNCKDADGYTPLMHAAVNNKIMSICTLKECGADFDILNRDGKTALMMVLSYNDYLFSQSEDKDIISALSSGSNSAVKDFIMHLLYADPYAVNEEGFTPVHSAIANDAPWAVKELLLQENNLLDSYQDKACRDYDILLFALGHNFTKFSDSFLKSNVSFFAKKDEGPSFLDLVVKVTTAEDAKEEDHVFLNHILKKSLEEISDNKKTSFTKWRKVLPHFLNEKVQDLLSEDVIKSLESSFLNRHVLNKITSKYAQRKGLEKEDTASQDTMIDEDEIFSGERPRSNALNDSPGNSPLPFDPEKQQSGHALKRSHTMSRN